MRLLGRHLLIRAGRKNAPLRKWLATWAVNVEAADWRCLDDIRQDYPSADGVRLASEIVVTIFNVKGNEYRLLSSIDYDVAVVQVLEIITHAEYDKELWKRRY
jgi:mRNA interferase HigB